MGNCRFCGTQLQKTFVDLGMSPLSNSYVVPERLDCSEKYYPLRVHVCSKCHLVQLNEFESPEAIFSDYVYFSSYSESWLAHAKQYTLEMQKRFAIDERSQVVEIASNDGYLLQYFVEGGVPVLGIEPAANVAKEAMKKGIETQVAFFGKVLAESLLASGKQADLLLGNNVLAHVPNINDFVEGLHILIKADGVITMEFPHLLRLMEECQFDTVYHEHFSYLSFHTVQQIFSFHGLRIFDVEELPTHGGSLRIFACREESLFHPTTVRVKGMLEKEEDAGLYVLHSYLNFGRKVENLKRELLQLLIELKIQGKQIVGYGAPAKGNTLLNYCGIRTDFLEYTVDRSPHKQNLYLPGTRIPIYSPSKILESHPDYILILPWNLKDEIMEQMKIVRDWGGKFIIPIPQVEVI